MPAVNNWIDLLRVRQWYKNLVIFLAIFFVEELFSLPKLLFIFLGFIGLSFLSSTNYILNDLIDLKKDRLHPEKKTRPLASGKIKTGQAILGGTILFIASLSLGYFLSFYFFLILLAIFFLTLIYSLFLKKEIFVDILIIAVNFVLRAVSGALIIKVEISPWLVLCPFFLSLFLSSAKRHGEIVFLGKEAEKVRITLKYYKKEIIDAILIISTTLLITSYALYSFSRHYNLLYTLPFSLYVIFRYFYLIHFNPEISRSPEKAITDWKLSLGIFLWVVITFLIIYLR